MKKILIFLLFLLIIPSVFAIGLNVEKVSTHERMVLGLSSPSTFEVQITNNGDGDGFKFYTYFTPSMYPKGTVYIAKGETKNVTIQIYPPENLKKTGFITFDYFIRGSDGKEQKETLTVKVIELEEAFEVGAVEVDPESSSVTLYLQNLVNFEFPETHVEFSSAFFELEEDISLGPYETKEFEVVLDKEDLRKLVAGYYTVNTNIEVENLEAELKSSLEFLEKKVINMEEDSKGFIINTYTLKKTNEGNVIEQSITTFKKSIISRLFTTFSPQPTSVNREGFLVYYTWQEEIKPGEYYEIKVRTNWLYPIIIIVLIVLIVTLVKIYTRKNIVLKKKINFIRSKGGEFALKVSILVDSRKYLENVNVIDALPPLVKLYHRFGGEEPTKVDEKGRRLHWKFAKLEAGEKRILSYVIYSKIGVLGKFALPRATAFYEKNGKLEESQSNKAFFIAEQAK